MTEIKPAVETADVASIVARDLGGIARNVAPVAGGNVASTFSCTLGDRAYIVRFNHQMGANFEKERFAARLLAGTGVPIPPIHRIGRFGDLHYAISDWVDGDRLDTLPPQTVAAVMPALIETLAAIHAADTSASSGFGTFGDDGEGLSPSWRGFLMAINEEEPEWEFYGTWHVMFETTFLERDLFDRIFARMAARLDRCLEDRSLLHGNYGFGNVLVKDGRITAVLDWIDAKYGDIVFDIAWLDFWAPGSGMAAAVQATYQDMGIEIANFDDRLRCYQDAIGLDALRFFAKSGDEGAYRWARERLLGFEA